MKQLLQNMRDGQAVVEEVPVPTPRTGMALVKTQASLVSAGTERMVVEFAEKSLIGKARSRPDLMRQVLEKARREGLISTVQAAFNRLDQPMALGYSSSGTIVELGDQMETFHVGQPVACAGGGYAVHAEYAVVPRNLLTPIPEGVDFESAAFTTLGAIALHGFRLAKPQIGESVAVIGMGLLGLLTAQIAAAAGCRVLGIDVISDRIELASALGFQACLRDEAEDSAVSHTGNKGFDNVIICADTGSNDPIDLAGVIARDRGDVVATGAVGLTIPRKTYFEKELSFINSRSYGPGRYDSSYEENGQDYPLGYIRWTEGRNFEAILDLLANSKLQVQPLITHRFPIENATEAYDVITGKNDQSFLGVLLTYDGPGNDERAVRIDFHESHVRHTPQVRLGVLGAGLFANATLLPAIKKVAGIENLGISSSGGLHAQHAARKFGFGYATSSNDEIIKDSDINTIAILTRHDTHADLVIKALQAGKHVFVEKPLAIAMDQLNEINEQLNKSSTSLLTVGFNRRFAPFAKKLFEFLTDRTEALYVHYRVNAGYIPLNHWIHDPKQGGGRIIGEGCHFIDFITFLVGAVPSTVSAVAMPDGGKYQEDNVSIRLTFPDGSVGVIDYLANGDKSLPKERIEVFCAGKIAILDDFRKLELIQDGRRKSHNSPQNKGWKDEWVQFVKAISETGLPPIPYEHLIGVTNASLFAVDSIRAKGAPQDI